jgi:hypothetical protein
MMRFMTKRLRQVLVGSLLLCQAIMLAVGATLHSPAMDDIAHLAAGISHWELRRFDLFKVNPPLVRIVAALPTIAAGAKTDWRRYVKGIDMRAEFPVMDDFVRANGKRTIWLVTLARWGLIPLMLLGGWICYRWARELYGDAAGVMALVLWCFCPNVLAYGQILTADAGAAALGVAASYTFWKWLREPAWDRALVTGIVLGLAELTKTTWVVLFGLWPAVWAVWRMGSGAGGWGLGIGGWGMRKIANCKLKNANCKLEDTTGKLTHPDPLPKKEGTHHAERDDYGSPKGDERNPKSKIQNPKLLQLLATMLLGLFCLNAGYDFEGSGTRLRNYLFVSRPLTGASEGQPVVFGNRFAKSWLGRVRVPLPRNYVEGIDLQWHDIEFGKPSYLRGRWQERGWWYWYLYALAVKVPLGTWGLFLLAIGARVGHRRHHAPRDESHHAERDDYGCREQVTWRDELVLLAPAIVMLALVSSQTGFSRYIRYVLPIFPFVFIWISSLGPYLGVWRFIAAFVRRGATFSRSKAPSSEAMESGSAANQSGDESPHSIRPTESGSAASQSGDESPHSIVGVFTALLLAWSVGSSLWYTPHWMSYFNELAGGPRGGPAHLIDAQVDWGQDLLYLKKWLDAHPEASRVGLVYFGPINPTVAGLDFLLPPKGVTVLDQRKAGSDSSRPHPSPLPEGEGAAEIAAVPRDLKPGWYAVSVNYLYGYDHYIYDPSGSREWVTSPYYSYFRRFQPVATAGYSIYIYHLAAEDIEAALAAPHE